MGEFAGYAIDEALDAENDRWLYRQGQMSDQDAFDLGIIDHEGCYGRASALRCNRCGSTDVCWRQQGGQWVLFSSQPGVAHVCPISTDGFAPINE